MNTWECKECGKEVQSKNKPKGACSCGAHAWVKLKGFPTAACPDCKFPKQMWHSETQAEPYRCGNRRCAGFGK